MSLQHSLVQHKHTTQFSRFQHAKPFLCFISRECIIYPRSRISRANNLSPTICSNQRLNEEQRNMRRQKMVLADLSRVAAHQTSTSFARQTAYKPKYLIDLYRSAPQRRYSAQVLSSLNSGRAIRRSVNHRTSGANRFQRAEELGGFNLLRSQTNWLDGRCFKSTTAEAQTVTEIHDESLKSSKVELEVEEKINEVEAVDDFTKYGVHPYLAHSLKLNEINSLFEVQTETMKVFSEDSSQNLAVRAKTGTGKTLGFGLPLLTTILKHKYEMGNTGPNDARDGARIAKPLAVVLTPTRELAIQVFKELQKFSRIPRQSLERLSGKAPYWSDYEINGTAIYGGAPYGTQIADIASTRRPIDFIVATPGRLKDIMTNLSSKRLTPDIARLLDRSPLDLSHVKVCVLDEADEMLKVGFKQELDEISSFMPRKEERLNLLFSATFSEEVKRMLYMYTNQAKQLNLIKQEDSKVPAEITLVNVKVSYSSWERVLAKILEAYCSADESSQQEGTRALIFVNTKAMCNDIASSSLIAETGLNCMSLHGDMTQASRESALNSFRQNKVKCIIATDVAARGLDIPKVDLVVHYGLPQQLESFVHRTGRTGRAGRRGTNIVLHGTVDIPMLNDIEKFIGRQFVQRMPPKSSQFVIKKLRGLEKDVMSLVKPPGAVRHAPSLALFEPTAKQLVGSIWKDVEGNENQSELRGRVEALVGAVFARSIGFINPQMQAQQTGNDSYSALSGTPGLVSVLMSTKTDASSSSFVTKGVRIDQREIQNSRNLATKLVASILGASKLSMRNAEDEIKNFTLTKDMEGCIIDVKPDIAAALVASAEEQSEDLDQDSSEPLFSIIKNDVPAYFPVRSDRRDQGDRRSEGKWGGSMGKRSDRFNRSYQDNRRPAWRNSSDEDSRRPAWRNSSDEDSRRPNFHFNSKNRDFQHRDKPRRQRDDR